jgi:predicted nuclease of predicted toxin-antitoxin system
VKIKLDENLPDALLPELRALGHDVDNVAIERLNGRPDPEVWAGAQESGRFLITQDLDFSDTRRFAPGTHAGLLLVRLAMPGRLALLEQIAGVFRSEDVASWAGCFVVLSEHKLRVMRPPVG